MQRVQQQLHADEAKHHREAVWQVHQAVKQAVEQEVELAQAQQRERVGGEHEEGFLGDAVDRRDGVEGEHDIDKPDRQQGDEQRGDCLLAGLSPRNEPVGVVRLGHRDDLAQRLHHKHVVRVRIVLVGHLVIHQLDGGVDEERGEDVEHVRPRLDDHRAEQDEHEAADQRDHDADEQHLLLVRARDLERAHDQGEDEQVIHRQRQLGDVAGEELHGVLGVPQPPDQPAEQARHGHVEQRPAARLLHRRLVRGTHVRDEVEDEKSQDHSRGNQPNVQGHMHK